jgi:hypothetical protein
MTTIAVPANATTEYFAGIVWRTLRARISTPVTGGTVTVVAVALRNNEALATVHRDFEWRRESRVSIDASASASRLSFTVFPARVKRQFFSTPTHRPAVVDEPVRQLKIGQAHFCRMLANKGKQQRCCYALGLDCA